MRTLLRHAVRLVVLVVVAASISALVPASATNPYASALSNLAVSQVMASATCANRGCSSDLTKCVHVMGLNCRRIDRCSETACP